MSVRVPSIWTSRTATQPSSSRRRLSAASASSLAADPSGAGTPEGAAHLIHRSFRRASYSTWPGAAAPGDTAAGQVGDSGIGQAGHGSRRDDVAE